MPVTIRIVFLSNYIAHYLCESPARLRTHALSVLSLVMIDIDDFSLLKPFPSTQRRDHPREGSSGYVLIDTRC